MTPIEIDHAVLLVRINRLYHDEMTAQELYEATRGVWRIGMRREKADYAFAVYKGLVKEAYTIERWHPAGTLHYSTRDLDPPADRWEFEGRPAPQEIRDRYRGASVTHYARWGNANPVIYVNC